MVVIYHEPQQWFIVGKMKIMMMRQYWLGKTKPKQVFRLSQNALNKFDTEFQKLFIQWNFLLTN